MTNVYQSPVAHRGETGEPNCIAALCIMKNDHMIGCDWFKDTFSEGGPGQPVAQASKGSEEGASKCKQARVSRIPLIRVDNSCSRENTR